MPPAPVVKAAPIGEDGIRLVEFFGSGGRVGLIVGPPRSGKTALRDAVANAIPGTVFRIANPLVTPLSLTRILVQVDALDDGDDAATLTAFLGAHAHPGGPTMLAVDDAHTLNDAALRVLLGLSAAVPTAETEGEADDARSRVMLLMAGDLALAERVTALTGEPGEHLLTIPMQSSAAPDARDAPRPTPLTSAGPALPLPPPPLTMPVAPPSSQPVTEASPDAVPLPPPPMQLAVARPDPEPEPEQIVDAPSEGGSPRRRRTGVLVAIAVVALAAVAIGVGSASRHRDGVAPADLAVAAEHLASQALPPADAVTETAVPEASVPKPMIVVPTPGPSAAPPPAPLQSRPEATVAPPSAPPPSAPPSSAPVETVAPRPMSRSDAQLRTEFRAFLVRTGRGAVADDPVRFESLFQDYLLWKSRTPPDGRPFPGR